MKRRTAILGACAFMMLVSCNKKPNETAPVETKAVSLKLTSPQIQTRAVENPIGEVSPTVTSATLYYYEAADIKPFANRFLSPDDIAKARSADGLSLQVPSNTLFISMAGNDAVNEKGKNILSYQSMNADGSDAKAFKETIPLLSPVAPITTSGAQSKVTLTPQAQLARIEVSGEIDPKPTDPDQTQNYEYVKVLNVYCNNYKLENEASTLQLYKKQGATEAFAWEKLPAVMQDAVSDDNRDAFGNRQKCAAYQVFPMTGVTSLPHIIIQVEYKSIEGKNPGVHTGYFTINRYKTATGSDFMESMQGGYIYKLDLSALSDKFRNSTDPNTGEVVDPTDTDPEMDKTDLTVLIEPVAWVPQEIIPGI
ncbi:hypothetical protein [Rikenella microfusus]|uniref:hypothetical protein n=1 Tax=Rikenella microfusus TaxID=28139 RepID=UPI002356AFF9|nr:hypothetical protein [Rikenella microfusus]